MRAIFANKNAVFLRFAPVSDTARFTLGLQGSSEHVVKMDMACARWSQGLLLLKLQNEMEPASWQVS